MSNQVKGKVNDKIKKSLCIALPILFLIYIISRFVLYYYKTDGFEGISKALPILAVSFMIFALFTSGCFSVWVYKDCKKRNDDGILWAMIVFVATPFIGLLIYFLRRSEIQRICSICNHKISLTANYCEKCGNQTEHVEVVVMEKKTQNLKWIVSGIICMVFMLVCLIGFIVSAVVGGAINTNIASNQKVWNSGVITMSFETNWKGVWKLNFHSASDGFIKESKLKIEDSSTQKLYADVSCENIPEDASLILWMVQEDKAESIDVTNLEEPLEIALNDFQNGKISIRLQINGVEDVKSEITIK